MFRRGPPAAPSCIHFGLLWLSSGSTPWIFQLFTTSPTASLGRTAVHPPKEDTLPIFSLSRLQPRHEFTLFLKWTGWSPCTFQDLVGSSPGLLLGFVRCRFAWNQRAAPWNLESLLLTLLDLFVPKHTVCALLSLSFLHCHFNVILTVCKYKPCQQSKSHQF